MNSSIAFLLVTCSLLSAAIAKGQSFDILVLNPVPKGTEKKIIIDGNLSEWKDSAFCLDGKWTMERVKSMPWFDEKKNRLTTELNEPPGMQDLEAEYFLGWTKKYIYFGASVEDNVNDISESKHAPKRWYYKDAIALFLEIPGDTMNEKFASGDHCFAFIADTSYPDYGAWWRHGTKDTSYVEEPASGISEYKVRFTERGTGNYCLESKISWKKAVKESGENPASFLKNPAIRIMIVHCDPDGGEYGGHLLIYGKDDNDNTWTKGFFRGIGNAKKRERKFSISLF